MKNTLEKEIEKKFRLAIAKEKGIAFKFVSPGFTGVPDRLVLLPMCPVAFVELKRPGVNKLKPRQLYVARQLIALGFKYYFLNDENSIKYVIKDIQAI